MHKVKADKWIIGKLYLKKQSMVGFKVDFVTDGGSRNSNLSFMLTEASQILSTHFEGTEISCIF